MTQEQDKTIDFGAASDAGEVADQAISDPDILAALVESLSGKSRRARQFSASALNKLSEDHIELLAPYLDQLEDALYRPEAQTRWQVLEVIERLVAVDADATEGACDGAESCLFDESSGIVRLHGFKFFATYACSSEKHAKQAWPLIDEAIQCYHGDTEFSEMLTALHAMAGAVPSDEVRKAIIDRMTFDANSGRGGLKHRASQIIEAAQSGLGTQAEG